MDGRLAVDRDAADRPDRDVGVADARRLKPGADLPRGLVAVGGGDPPEVELGLVEVERGDGGQQAAHPLDLAVGGLDAGLQRLLAVAQLPLVALPRAAGALQPLDLGHRRGVVENQRVAGRQRLDLGEAHGVVGDVVDLAQVELAAGDLPDERRLALDGLPVVGVKRLLDDVADDLDLGVLVALAQGAAVALLKVGGTPRAVEVMQRDRARLDVGPDAHLLGGADDHRHLAGAARLEQPRLLGVVAGLVDEPHLLGGDPALGEQQPQLVIGVPALLLGGRQIAEDDLQRAGDGRFQVGAGDQVAALGVGLVDRGDLVGGVLELAAALAARCRRSGACPARRGGRRR